MDGRLRDLQLRQTDAMLAMWRDARLAPRPVGGWAKAIREALGMTAAALARRLGMTGAGVNKLESAEADGAITLASLRKLANALDCELHYALVPRMSLAERLQERAEQVARDRLRPVSHSMALEDQAVGARDSERQTELLAQQLLLGSRRE